MIKNILTALKRGFKLFDVVKKVQKIMCGRIKKPKPWKQVIRTKDFLESLKFEDSTPRFIDRNERVKVHCCDCGEVGECIFSNLRVRKYWRCPECVSSLLKSKEVKYHKKQTMQERYGCDYPLQSSVIQERKTKTINERFGCDHAAQNHEIALKQAIKTNNTIIKIHWRTGELLSCRGSYEQKVVDYLNKNKIDFKWQPKPVPLSTGRFYIPDLYLIDQNTWVEIKGHFRGGALEKWNEFHKIIQPNSELWDKKKLQEMKII